jgi:hypothetical protein
LAIPYPPAASFERALEETEQRVDRLAGAMDTREAT